MALLHGSCGNSAFWLGDVFPLAARYRAQQTGTLVKYRRGLPPGPEADGVDALLRQLEDGQWP